MIDKFINQIDQVSPGRQDELAEIARKIAQKGKEGITDIVFVCTHNSRRSQISEVVLSNALFDLGLNFEVYSCGTEATAIPNQIIELFKRQGYTVKGNNELIQLSSKSGWKRELWSKTIDDEGIPKSVIALMVCDQAAESCPFSPKFAVRIPLTYADPKLSDGSEEEEKAYNKAFSKIGKELCYLAMKLEENWASGK